MEDNVKGVTLLGKDWRTSASASENHWVKLRERDFGSDDYFDRTAVTRLEVYGYLPIREEKPKGRDRWMSFDGRHTCGEIHFESCMNVIRRFLSDCFDLDADIHAIEIASEHWTIPVRQFERKLV